VAGYPEKHFESPNFQTDIKYLKKKVEMGAEYVVTQMFFDNNKYFQFVEECRSQGITIPIIPGLKPFSTKAQLTVLPSIFHIDLPDDLVGAVEACKDNQEVRQVGVEWAIQQSIELKKHNVPCLHFYTMGKSDNKEFFKMLPFAQSLIIIPTFNEIDNIEKMIQTIFQLYPKINLLIIDDGSPDGTAKVVKDYQDEHTNLHLIQRSGKLGLGTAYLTGFKWALEREFQFIFEMDCDFSHDPKDIEILLEAAQTNDLIIGSRYIDGIRIINWPFKRLLLSYCASIYTRIITGIPVLDVTGGFKCFSREALTRIDLNKIISNGYSFQVELNFKVWSKGMKIKEIPIIFTERRDGQSKMSGGIVKEAVFSVIMLRVRKVFGML
jgi:dolichol-phosphate mannosyltransferase